MARTGTVLLLDSEGVSKLVGKDVEFLQLVKALLDRREIRIAAPATALVEGVNPRTHPAAASWALSGVRIVDVSAPVAQEATGLLRDARRHGHAHALDAIVCACAVLAASDEEVTILTSDPQDLRLLLAGHSNVFVLAI
jgi:tRNA isopentenyl-2-thiomethyl-A-37 hydroxylase MiaE